MGLTIHELKCAFFEFLPIYLSSFLSTQIFLNFFDHALCCRIQNWHGIWENVNPHRSRWILKSSEFRFWIQLSLLEFSENLEILLELFELSMDLLGIFHVLSDYFGMTWNFRIDFLRIHRILEFHRFWKALWFLRIQRILEFHRSLEFRCT